MVCWLFLTNWYFTRSVGLKRNPSFLDTQYTKEDLEGLNSESGINERQGSKSNNICDWVATGFLVYFLFNVKKGVISNNGVIHATSDESICHHTYCSTKPQKESHHLNPKIYLYKLLIIEEIRLSSLCIEQAHLSQTKWKFSFIYVFDEGDSILELSTKFLSPRFNC